MSAWRVRPAAVVAPVVVAALCLALRAPAGVRVVPMMAVLVATPGFVGVRHVRTRSRMGVAVIACAIGIAWLVLTSEVLVYLRWWKPAVLIPATLCVSMVLGMSPLHRAAHAIRWDRCRTVCVSFAGAALGFVVALQTYAVMRTPYSAAELRPLHVAWLLATGRRGDSAVANDSMLAEIQARLIPFHNPSVGSLLGARWLQLGLLALTVTLAGLWARAGADRRGSPAVWATVVGAAALVHIDAAGPDALLAAPLLMGAGCCIAANRNGTTRPGVAGFLLAAAALESRICAFAAAAMVISEVRRSYGRRPHTFPAWFGPRVRMLAGVVAGVVCVSAAGAVFHVRLGALSSSADDAGGTDGSALPLAVRIAVLVFGALGWGLVAVSRRTSRLGVGVPQGSSAVSMAAFLGAALGVAFDQAPTAGDLAIPAIILAVVVGPRIWSAPRTTDATLSGGTGRGTPGRQRLVWQFAATVGLIAMAVVTRSIDLGVHDNRAQLARVAYVLDQTGVGDSVYDPLGTVSFARVRVGRGDVGLAALAIIPNSALAADRDLRALVESNFEPTPFPDVWRAALRWTTPPVLFEPSQSFASDAAPAISP